MSIFRFYADDSEFKIEGGRLVMLFGGLLVNEQTELELIKAFRKLKFDLGSKYLLPVKWNIKNLKQHYIAHNKEKEYDAISKNIGDFKISLFELLGKSDARFHVSILEQYPFKKLPGKRKQDLLPLLFAQFLMALAMDRKDSNSNLIQLNLDWPDSSNSRVFNDEYFSGLARGRSTRGVVYSAGKLFDLNFMPHILYADSKHSEMLQIADMVVGATKDFVSDILNDTSKSLGYKLCCQHLNSFFGMPINTSYGINFSPDNSVNKVKLYSCLDEITGFITKGRT
jgi:hypothetical protein